MAIEYDKINLGRVKGEKGETGLTGNGISSIATNESSADGGENSVVISMTDGSTKTFVVRNGSKGEKGDQGIQGIQGIQGEHGGVLSESEMNAIYMKKVADSDLYMNGKVIRDISKIVCKPFTGAGENNTYFIPRYGYTDLGASSSDVTDYIKKWILKIIQDFNGSRGIYIGNANPSTTGIMIFYLYSAALNADTGLPNYCSGIYYSYADSDFIRFYTLQGVFYINKVSEFPLGDTPKNNRINSMGSNYIRYENGLQMCWEEITVTVPNTTGAWNSATLINLNHNFPQLFSAPPSCLAQNSDPYNYVIGAVRAGSGSISTIEVYRQNAIGEGSRKFKYFAIGKWK